MNLPKSINLDKLINNLRVVCWEASDILLNYSQKIKDEQYQNEFIKYKGINDPVTLADVEVNSLIFKYFKENHPNEDWFILSEETNKEELKLQVNKDWIWVLDPLDGTKDFLQKTENFAVQLALNYKNQPLIGFVLIPLKDQLWITEGKSVWFENKAGIKEKTVLPINKKLSEMKLITSKNHKNYSLQELIKKIGFKEKIEMGSIGCKVAALIRGEADIYISISTPGKSSPKDWDFAAPDAILRAAGGAITNIDGKELLYNTKGYEHKGIIIATNNALIHNDICMEIKNIISED